MKKGDLVRRVNGTWNGVNEGDIKKIVDFDEYGMLSLEGVKGFTNPINFEVVDDSFIENIDNMTVKEARDLYNYLKNMFGA